MFPSDSGLFFKPGAWLLAALVGLGANCDLIIAKLHMASPGNNLGLLKSDRIRLVALAVR